MAHESSKGLAIAVILGWLCAAVISISVTSAYRTRIELDTRKDCFASNERIAATLATSKDGFRSTELNRCDWR